MAVAPKAIRAPHVVALLRTKHSGDVFVTECKDGPTQTAGARPVRLDAWVMNRSWANACATGYEVKVSRGDFLQDQKWRQYLGLCNAFYFVCPHGLIQPDELPHEAGLLWVSKTGNRLFTKKKAPQRDVEIPESLYRYVLMCRTTITDENHKFDSRIRWREWLRKREKDRELGFMVRGKISELFDEAKREARVARENLRGYEHLRERLTELGLPEHQHSNTWKIDNTLKTVLGEVTPDLRYRIKQLQSDLESLERALGD